MNRKLIPHPGARYCVRGVLWQCVFMKKLLAIILVSQTLTSSSATWAGDPACLAKIKTAGQIGLIKDMKATAGGMEFIVDEDVYPRTAFRSKQGIVDSINCAFLDPGKQFNPILFRGHRSNKVLARQENGTLTVN